MNRKTRFICPHPKCDYIGIPRVEGYGSVWLTVVLTLLGFLPGLIYVIFKTGLKYTCPNCAMVLDKE